MSGQNLRAGNVQSCGCLKSTGEMIIGQILTENNIKYEKEYIFPDLKDKNYLRFDFAIFNEDNTLSHLVEFDGIQHFQSIPAWGGEEYLKDVQYKDNLKNQYCKEKNLKLIRIKYYDIITLEKILGKSEGGKN